MKDRELEVLVEQLESQMDMGVAELDGVSHALAYLRPDVFGPERPNPESLVNTDGAMIVMDRAYPDWTVHIHGRANDRDGHWRCMLREGEARDNDRVIGSGRSPFLSQAILAALLRLAAEDRRDGAAT